jgi:hypothetical protein
VHIVAINSSPVVMGATQATGVAIKKGYSPYIGENGNWYEYDETQKAFVDTGVYAKAAEETDPTVPAWAKEPNPPKTETQFAEDWQIELILNS